MKRVAVLLACAGWSACATARATRDPTPTPPPPAPSGVILAGHGMTAPRTSADLVVQAWNHAGRGGDAPPAMTVTDLYRAAARSGKVHHRKRPTVGDVAFFHDSCDANADGRRNDPLTLAAVVERVDADGTVVLLTRVRQGVLRLRMNLERPAARRHPSTHKVLNHYLVPQSAGAPARTTAQLWTAFASPPQVPARLAAR